MTTKPSWDERMAALWSAIDDYDEAGFLARVEALAAELAPGDPRAPFELASANDSIGRPQQAAPLYRQALAAGLHGEQRRRAVIQLASTLRNLGHADESVALLRAERATGSDDLDDAVDAFLALALVDSGHQREATGVALGALARHLTRYRRSLTNYAQALVDDDVGQRG